MTTQRQPPFARPRISRASNPYLQEATAAGFGAAAAHDAGRSNGSYQTRLRLVSLYSWAIPDDDALATIERYAPVIEIGAGTGYWAWMLRKRGVNILAFDNCPPTDRHHQNEWHNHPRATGIWWTKVLLGGPEQAERYPERTLLLCWPPYHTNMASEALTRYTGSTLIYIGEPKNGVTGDERFHELLATEWGCVREQELHTWAGMHDRLRVYLRASALKGGK